MKSGLLIFVATAVSCFAISPQAYSRTEPFWACSIAAQTFHDNRLYAFLRGGHVAAYGILNCVSRNGSHTLPTAVTVDVKQAGYEFGFLFPADHAVLDVLQFRAGVMSQAQVYGRYAIRPRVGLRFSARSDSASQAHFQVDSLFAGGIDFSGSIVDIEPARN
ncbi:MAG: hypothetical protein ACXVA9_02510 [Bdellovibrionales bacterium]